MALRKSETPPENITSNTPAVNNLTHSPRNANHNSLAARGSPERITRAPRAPIRNRKTGPMDISCVLNILCAPGPCMPQPTRPHVAKTTSAVINSIGIAHLISSSFSRISLENPVLGEFSDSAFSLFIKQIRRFESCGIHSSRVYYSPCLFRYCQNRVVISVLILDNQFMILGWVMYPNRMTTHQIQSFCFS